MAAVVLAGFGFPIPAVLRALFGVPVTNMAHERYGVFDLSSRRRVGSSISTYSNQLSGCEDFGRRVSIRLTGTPDARNHMLVREMLTVPGEQNVHLVYRGDRCMMSVLVRPFG